VRRRGCVGMAAAVTAATFGREGCRLSIACSFSLSLEGRSRRIYYHAMRSKDCDEVDTKQNIWVIASL
jgi:hypothetical protein